MTDIFGGLLRYARTHPDLPPACYRIRRVDWVLDIGEAGTTVTPYGRDDAVPTMRRSGTAPAPLLAVDTAAYVLGAHDEHTTPAQAEARASAFWAQMGRWAAGSSTHPAVVAALWILQQQGPVPHVAGLSSKDRIAVRVEGVWLHRLDDARHEWARIVTDAKSSPDVGLCIGCHQRRPLARTLPNAIPAALVPGADKELQLAVLPLAERTGRNAQALQVCVACGDRATSALEALLADRARTARTPGQGSATAVWGIGPGADRAALALLGLLTGDAR